MGAVCFYQTMTDLESTCASVADIRDEDTYDTLKRDADTPASPYDLGNGHGENDEMQDVGSFDTTSQFQIPYSALTTLFHTNTHTYVRGPVRLWPAFILRVLQWGMPLNKVGEVFGAQIQRHQCVQPERDEACAH